MNPPVALSLLVFTVPPSQDRLPGLSMILTSRTACLSFLLCFAAAVSPSRAQQAGSGRQAPAPSLQQQVDDLKAGQRQILEELGVIKALLKERNAEGSPSVPKAGARLSVNVFGEPFKGAAGARVAILEYSDFDCPFCAKYSTGIFHRIDAEYIQTGKVKYFFRDLPLPVHPHAQFKAQVARCAGEQGKFWEAHDRLFADQRPLDEASLAQFIKGLGLDAASFNASLASGKYAESIRLSVASAERMQINGAPAFLFGTLGANGQVLGVTRVMLGAESYDAFKAILDELLGASGPVAAAAPAARTAGTSTCG